MSGARVRLEPAWVLHRRDYRDSSQIVDALTPGYGRLSLVARGVRRPKSPHRGLLQPFRPLLLSWTGRRELVTLTDVERAPGAVLELTGDALLSGFYVNELVLRLTHRFDPQPELFAVYSETLEQMNNAPAPHAALRAFEFDLLDTLGFAIDFSGDASSGTPLASDARYRFTVQRGFDLVPAGGGQTGTFSGAVLLAIGRRDWSVKGTLGAARQLATQALDWQLGDRPLQTRTVLQAMRQQDSDAGVADEKRE